MEKRELVVAAMNNKPTSRPVVGFWYHFPENANDEQILKLTKEYHDECNLDMIKIMSDGYFNHI